MANIVYPISSTPPAGALAAILAPRTDRTRRIEIFHADGFTSWKSLNEGLVGGSISVDQTRDERRAFELTLDNTEHQLAHQQGHLWYDKIIKAYMGVEWQDTTNTYSWESQVGEFMIDSITSHHFPNTIQIQGRDYTKKLMTSKFRVATLFSKGTPVENVVKAIVINGGIAPNRLILPLTGQVTGKDWYFDRGVQRVTAAKEIAQNYGYEIFFNGFGNFVMRKFEDPSTSPPMFKFQTGAGVGNLISFSKRSGDSRLYNSISVSGESANTTPVYGLAENRNPQSPTSIPQIGERVYEYTSAFITTAEQARTVAANLLWQHALEEYDVNLEALNIFWLEAGNIVDFLDPTPYPGEPTRYLLSNFTLPFALGPMPANAKRVVKVNQ